MRPISLSIVVGVAAILCSCSWITTFIVINDTENPIEVFYRLAEGAKLPPCPDDYIFMKPRIAKRALRGELASLKNDGTVADYACDSAARTVTLQVPPDYAVALFTVNNYGGYRTEQDVQKYTYLEYALTSLRIRGRSGEIQFSGTQVTKNFTKESVALYALTYQ